MSSRTEQLLNAKHLTVHGPRLPNRSLQNRHRAHPIVNNLTTAILEKATSALHQNHRQIVAYRNGVQLHRRTALQSGNVLEKTIQKLHLGDPNQRQ